MSPAPACRFPVRLKLGLLLAGTLALAVGTVSAVLLRVSREAIEGEVLQRGQVITRQLAKVAKEGLLFDDELLLHSHLAEVAREEGVVRATVVDEKGEVRASTALDGASRGAGSVPGPGQKARKARRAARPDPGSAPAADARGPLVVNVTRDGDEFLLDAPVAVQAVRIGEVRLVLAPGPAIERAAARSRRAILAVAIGLLVGGSAVAFVTGRRFVRPVERLAGAVALAATGDLTREVPIATRDEIGALTRGFNGMLRGLRERETLRREAQQVTDAFRRYVSRDVADEVLRYPDACELGGQLREVTVLFADIRNFSQLSQTMSARDIVNLLNKYFQMMTDAIFAHGGTLDKFMGDGVMAVFGAPVRHPDHASRALWTAIAIQGAIDEENARRLAWGRYRAVTVGIGIDSGEAVVGNIGARERMDYTAIGDCVNTAARLQALARGDEVLATGAVFERAGHEVEALALSPARLRGKEEPVPVYRILGPRGARPDVPAVASSARAARRAAAGETPLAAPMVEAVSAIAALARGRA